MVYGKRKHLHELLLDQLDLGVLVLVPFEGHGNEVPLLNTELWPDGGTHLRYENLKTSMK